MSIILILYPITLLIWDGLIINWSKNMTVFCFNFDRDDSFYLS